MKHNETTNPFSHSSHSSQASLLSTTGGATSKSHLCFRHPRKRLDWLDMRNPNAFQDAGKMRKCCCWSLFSKKSPWLFWLFWGLESVFYNGTNVTDQVEDLVYPESGQQDMTRNPLNFDKSGCDCFRSFVLCGEKALRTFFWMRILLIAPGQTPPSCKSSWWTFPLQPWCFGSKPWSSIVCISQDEGLIAFSFYSLWSPKFSFFSPKILRQWLQLETLPVMHVPQLPCRHSAAIKIAVSFSYLNCIWTLIAFVTWSPVRLNQGCPSSLIMPPKEWRGMHSQSGLHSNRAKMVVKYSDHLQKNCLMLGCFSIDASMVHLRLTVTWQKEYSLMLLSRPVEISCIAV